MIGGMQRNQALFDAERQRRIDVLSDMVRTKMDRIENLQLELERYIGRCKTLEDRLRRIREIAT